MRQRLRQWRSLAGMVGGGTRGRELHVRHEAAGLCSAVGGAAVAWPLAARSQRAERIRRIGVLLDVASLIRAAIALYLICRCATGMI